MFPLILCWGGFITRGLGGLLLGEEISMDIEKHMAGVDRKKDIVIQLRVAGLEFSRDPVSVPGITTSCNL